MLFIALLLFANLASASNPCAVELEKAIFKLKACGIEYFENLACPLNYQIPQNLHFGNAVAAEFCLSFSQANRVGLGLLNAQGLNLCTLNNLNANSMS